ncbi:hypothetical protein EHS13_13585 [Paenibacillus psychroresistens]|uniref:Uncharacterized protein n=1 Tax=Paenibacillus psychroresistens TaxID=1778678 RepID=A0A6B8RJP2_9BACL|nr:hypothetical protein [Paenibacillus psychroresistens]QGQ95835.1 hypothetical protein EHS13_13585 [Paenibacillus psychroresistens]
MNETTLVQHQENNSGSIVELDFGSAADLRKKLVDMKQKLNLTKEFFREVMQEGLDYGIIPGTDKPSLWKPGAEGLLEFYNYAPTIANKTEEKNLETGYYSVDITIRLIHRSTGVVIGEGVGCANTFESRYRWRWLYEKDIPKGIHKEDLFVKEFKGTGGSKYYKYRMDNDDMFSIWNTVLKMAKKRALVDATLAATRSSGIFTQTEEELEAYLHGDDPEGGDGESGGKAAAAKNTAVPSATTITSSTTIKPVTPLNKNRVLALMKTAVLDWNGLAAQATEALGRPIKKVMDDLKSDADWIAVGQHLDLLIESRAAFAENKDELDFDNLPPELRGEQ